MSKPNAKYPIIPEAVYWEKVNNNEPYTGFVHYKNGEISFVLPEVVVEARSLDGSNNKFSRYAMINKIKFHEQFVPLSLACDAISLDDADIRIKEQIMQFNIRRDGVKAKFQSFLENKIKDLRKKELNFLTDLSGIKGLRLKCETLLMKLIKNDSFPVSLDDIPIEIYNESETVEYRRVYNIKNKENGSSGDINAIDPIAKFHSDIQKRDPFAYDGAQQIPMKAVAVGSAVTTLPIMLYEAGIISTEMWALKAGVSAAAQYGVNGREFDAAAVVSDAILAPGASAFTNSLLEYHPFSDNEKVKVVGYNKSFKNAAVDFGVGYYFGKQSSIIGDAIAPSMKSYKGLYFLYITNELSHSIFSNKTSNGINSLNDE